MKRAAVVIVSLAVIALTIVALRRAFQAEQDEVAADSRFEVRYTVILNGSAASLDEAADALLIPCAAQVETQLVTGPIQYDQPDRFRAVMSPRLDTADETELRGCLHDLRVESMRAAEIELIGEDPAGD